jgi:2-isopropylmalate synthase
MTDHIRIFDTTLRDGEQSPGCSMNLEEKLRVAAQLEALGVDIIEAGFAIASDGDFEAVREVARQCQRATVASLARASLGDIDRAWAAVRFARAPRIHTFIATSPLHMQVKLNMTPEAVLEAIRASVTHARNLCPDVEWSAEDATRTDPDFLARAVEIAINAGARTINLPDTVGYATPETYGAMFHDMLARVPNADQAVFSTHCHNDLGLAVANTLAAVMAGARQVEATVNGIGERAGNAAVEEIAMALRVRDAERRRHALLDRRGHVGDHPRQPDGQRHHRHGGAGEQGDRRGQRLRPRKRHPSGRHDQGQFDL